MKLVFSALVGAFATAWAFQEWFSSFIILAVVCLLIFYWRWFYVAARTCRRDFTALYNYIRMLLLARRFSKSNSAICDIFHEVVLKHPDKKCFLMDDEVWTFRQVEDFSLRVSAALRAKGVKKDDVVGLMMSNSPELPATWLGITRLGAIVPLINTNQTGTALLHSINVAKCDVVIYGEEYEQAFRDIKGELDPSIKLLKYTHRPLNAVRNQVVEPSDFTAVLENTPLPFWFRSEGGGFSGKLLYIYTSGTTGLPKAAVITTAKVVTMASGMQFIGRIKPTDVVYCPMPLYHSAGGCIAIGQAFVFGCTVALRKKFSASSYFKDCIKYNATVAQYIGEMCRYVLSTPPSPMDKQHKVRLVFGNGMRPTVWSEFVERFNIQWVSEFYGATEGIGNTANADNKLGSIGFISRIIPSVYPIAVLKVNEETGEPIRTPDGLCQMAKPNEPGLFVGKINPNLASRAYLGYVDKEATNKKIIRNVFTLGDSAFISGDILVADELGYLYFRDRTGDTFRWRGENVSTTEVEAAISRVAEHRDAVVYGVEIPNTEGRAGMCGIVDTDDSLDLNKLLQDISKDLPKYARPIFMRKMNNVDLTGTYKMRKVDLQREGYDPNKVSDKLFYLDPKLDKYLPLGPEEYRIIVSGQIRL